MTSPSPYGPPAHTPQGGAAQPQRFASPFEQPTHFAPPEQPTAPQEVLPVPVPKAAVHAHHTILIWLFGGLGFVMVVLIAYYLLALGPVATSVAMILALFPLAIVLLGVRYIDRWEPEPKGLVFFALAWGAIASVALTLIVDVILQLTVGDRSEAFSTVVQAPIVEEIFKGFGVFLIFLIARAAFDGPVDGVVYGSLVGAGFAFTENIQYFGVSLITGGAPELTATFFLRGIMSPFAHVMFTAVLGFAIGLSARKTRSKSTALRYALVGLIGAIALHALWNGSAVFGHFFPLYILLQVPLFIASIVGVVALRREEARLTFARLTEYAEAGWFTPQEVTMLATRPGQKAGLVWAASLRGDRRPLMKAFIRDATELAAVRQRAIAGRDPQAAMKEHLLLARTAETRHQLLAR